MKNITKSYRQIKKLPDWWYIPISLIMKLMKTCFMKTSTIDPYDCINMDKIPYITVTWHNRLLYFPAMFEKKYRKRTFALVSPSRDGQYVTDLVKQFGVRSVRGSSSKRGCIALHEALRVLKGGNNLSVTPDGPRGPKYKMSKGPIMLASKTGYPILPLSINASRYWELKSWDNFRIPKPFCKISLVAGKSIEIPPDLSDEEMEKWRLYVEEKLMEISD
ncbi:MAG TPA: lysophospholipid acyltransferase family protein [Victivallales bacterium]|nr:lysophospholipid acyltransferase family protein [Victivallales bacterium]